MRSRIPTLRKTTWMSGILGKQRDGKPGESERMDDGSGRAAVEGKNEEEDGSSKGC